MADQSRISWTDASWNVVTGCAPVSPGCANCYAKRMARRLQAVGQPRYEYGFEVRFHRDVLSEPLHWRKPRRVFVCSMGDLFHESVTNEISAVFGVMSACPQHTFQVCTKRPERALEWYEWAEAFSHNGDEDPTLGVALEAYRALGAADRLFPEKTLEGFFDHRPWPLPNVHLLVSCEDQQRSNERIPLLLRCQAAVHGVSLEPLLGPIDIQSYLRCKLLPGNVWRECCCDDIDPSDRPCPVCEAKVGIDWVIVGCESGPKRRPCNLDWVHSIVDQCVEAQVPCFVKQLDIDGKVSRNPEEWPEWARVQQYP